MYITHCIIQYLSTSPLVLSFGPTCPMLRFQMSCYQWADMSFSRYDGSFHQFNVNFQWVSEWVSEWLLFNANSAILQLYHGDKLIINEMMMMSALFYTNTLSWIFIVLAHWNNSPWVDMSLHSDTLFWFRANQSLLFLLNAACLPE